MTKLRFSASITAAAGAFALAVVGLWGCQGDAATTSIGNGDGPPSAAPPVVPRDPSAPAFTLYFTGDVRGEVDPVGCSNGYYGGMARAAGVLASLSVPADTLVIDGGDFLAPGIDEAGLSARMSSYAAMGYGALALGDNEVSFGVEKVVRAAASNGVRLISSNVLDATSLEPVTDPTWVWTSEGGVKVGLLALIEPPRVGGGTGKAEGVVVGDPYAAASAALESLKAQSVDVVVAVAHGRNDMATNLATKFPEIDFVISGHSGRTLDAPLVYGRAYIGSSASGGSHLGEVTFWLPVGTKRDYAPAAAEPRFALVQTDEMRAAEAKARAKEIESVERELNYVQSRSAEAGSHGGAAQRLSQLEARHSGLKAAEEAEAAGGIVEPTEGRALRLRYRMHRLGLELPEDNKVAAILAPYARKQ